MSDDPPDGLARFDVSPPPSIDLNRISSIRTFEVMESQLDTLDTIVAQENRALGFLTFAAGGALGLTAAMLTATALSPLRLAVLVALLGLAVIETARSALAWNAARKARPKFIAMVRAQTSPPRSLAVARPLT